MTALQVDIHPKTEARYLSALDPLALLAGVLIRAS